MSRLPHAVFVNRFYWPDMAATAQMLTDLAEDLAAAGWKVTVVTSQSTYAAAGAPLPGCEERNGVRILRVRSSRFGRHRTLGRITDYGTYLLGALARLLSMPTYDLVVAMSDPPMLFVVARWAARLRRARTVYWIQDLFPQLAARLGTLREDGLLYRIVERLVRGLHRGCDAVVALGPAMASGAVGAGTRPERTTFVHNWADTDEICPVAAADNPFLREHGLEGKFVVLYSGNAGRAHTFDALLEAIRELRADSQIAFVFIGGGRKMEELRAAARREGLDNLRFLDYLPREQLKYSLSAASISLVTEDPSAAGLLVPSKTYGILASGRPILFIGAEGSDVARVVRDAECGFVVAPDDPEAIVRIVRRLRARPEEVAGLGANGRRRAVAVYDRRRATARWREVVGELLSIPATAAKETNAETLATRAAWPEPERGRPSLLDRY